jgi:hypothetical protein
MSDSEVYWFQKFEILFNNNKLNEFYPKSGMKYSEKVNALVRLSIYIGLLASIILRNYLYLYIPILTMLLTYVLFLFRQMDSDVKKTQTGIIEKLSQSINGGTSLSAAFDAQNELEHFSNSATDATYPSQNNPFMNPLPFDDRKRPEAINPEAVSNKVEKYFNRNLFREIGDIFSKENSQREFYTVPATTYPSHQDDFANWLYKTPPTCKEGNGNQCVANNSDRLMSSFKLPYITNKLNSAVFK